MTIAIRTTAAALNPMRVGVQNLGVKGLVKDVRLSPFATGL